MIQKHRIGHIKFLLIFLWCILLFFLSIVIFFIIDDHIIHGSKRYNEINSLIKSKELIGLDFEQCYDKLYTSSYINDLYAKLKNENGVVFGKKENIYYSSYAIFYAGTGVSGHDYRNRNYVIKLYFNDDVKVVFAELIPTEL